MKKLNGIMMLFVIMYLIAVVAVNAIGYQNNEKRENDIYNISINRIVHAIEQFEEEKGMVPDNFDNILDEDLYKIVKGIAVCRSLESMDNRFLGGDFEYVIHRTPKAYYKIMYEEPESDYFSVLYYNIVSIILLLSAVAFFMYIKINIIKPFHQLEKLPYELSKGNLVVPLKENKNRYFGKYLWGMDLLREKLESDREKELELIKEKKMLLLSLSHDIKTPLSAIKLYAKALSRNLYKTEEKRNEVAVSIDNKATEIEQYVSDIIKASKEDFLNFDVIQGEVYINDIFAEISDYYKEKMELNQIDFSICNNENCIVRADRARLVEVIQNVVENAMKYGDGKRIRINCEHNEEEYRIAIRNTGCTLEDKEVPHIFDSFFRGSNVEKKKGSGLGLYICRCIMQLMDGAIVASIKTEGTERIMEVRIVIRVY